MLTTRPPRIRDSWQETGLPIPCQVRGPMPCRPVLDFHGFFGPIHADCSPYSNGAPIRSRNPHTHPQPPCIPIPPYWPHARRDQRGIAVGPHRRSPIRISRPPAIHKKLQSPQSHISWAIHCSPCLTDPHAPRIPIRVMFLYVSVDPSCHPQAPKNPTPNPARPALRSRKSSANQSPHLLCSKGGGSGNAQGAALPARPRLHRPGFTAIHAYRIRSGPQKWGITSSPRPAAGPPRSTHPIGPLKFPEPTTGGLASMTTRQRRRR